VNIKEIEYKNFGKCLEITHHELECIITLDLGPRIISFKRKGKENVFFEDSNRIVSEQGAFFDQNYGIGTKWFIYGGHRLWSSPQDMFSYYPDNDQITYQVKDCKLLLFQKVQKATNLELMLEIDFSICNKLKIYHRITNRGTEEKKLSPWALTVLKGNGIEILPLPKNKTDLSPQRFYSLWDFGGKANDERLYFGDKYFVMKHDPNNKIMLKIGLKIVDNCALYLLENDVFIKEFEYNENFVYPDNNVNFETYEDHRFIELESLGEYKNLKTNEYVEHTEFWSLWDNIFAIPKSLDEEEMDHIVSYYKDKIQ
jgi:hypothetical protein